MKYLEILKKLRTKRVMKPVKINNNDLKHVITHVRYAASARNIQPLRYVLISEPANVKQTYLGTNLPKTHGIKDEQAPSAFIIIGIDKAYSLPEMTLGMDIGIASQIIRETLLELDLNSIPINMFDHAQIKKLINDETYQPLHCIAIGKSTMEVNIYEGNHTPTYFFDKDGGFNVAKLTEEELIKAEK